MICAEHPERHARRGRMLVLLFVAIQMLVNIEETFNDIWGVTRRAHLAVTHHPLIGPRSRSGRCCCGRAGAGRQPALQRGPKGAVSAAR